MFLEQLIMRERVLTLAVGRTVKMVRYCGVKVQAMTHETVSVSIANQKKRKIILETFASA